MRRWFDNIVNVCDWDERMMNKIKTFGYMAWVIAFAFGLIVWILSPLIAGIMSWQHKGT